MYGYRLLPLTSSMNYVIRVGHLGGQSGCYTSGSGCKYGGPSLAAGAGPAGIKGYCLPAVVDNQGKGTCKLSQQRRNPELE